MTLLNIFVTNLVKIAMKTKISLIFLARNCEKTLNQNVQMVAHVVEAATVRVIEWWQSGACVIFS